MEGAPHGPQRRRRPGALLAWKWGPPAPFSPSHLLLWEPTPECAGQELPALLWHSCPGWCPRCRGGGARRRNPELPTPGPGQSQQGGGGPGGGDPPGRAWAPQGDSGAGQVERTHLCVAAFEQARAGQAPEGTSSGGEATAGSGARGDRRGLGCARRSLEQSGRPREPSQSARPRAPTSRSREGTEEPGRDPALRGTESCPWCTVAMFLQDLRLGKSPLGHCLIWFALSTTFLQTLQIRELSLGEFWQRRVRESIQTHVSSGPGSLYGNSLPPPTAPGLRSPGGEGPGPPPPRPSRAAAPSALPAPRWAHHPSHARPRVPRPPGAAAPHPSLLWPGSPGTR